jgi:hypothetical protein
MCKLVSSFVLILALCIPAYAADDYVVGKYEHIDKLTIEYDTWSARVSGDGKHVAGFIEAFYDNISENYRKNPKLRDQVLEQMEKAKKSGHKGFNLYHDEYWIAFQDTTGRQHP